MWPDCPMGRHLHHLTPVAQHIQPSLTSNPPTSLHHAHQPLFETPTLQSDGHKRNDKWQIFTKTNLLIVEQTLHNLIGNWRVSDIIRPQAFPQESFVPTPEVDYLSDFLNRTICCRDRFPCCHNMDQPAHGPWNYLWSVNQCNKMRKTSSDPIVQ